MANEQEYENQIEEQPVNQMDEERYNKIRSIIDELAARNPNMSPEKVALLKGFYLADTRSISAIVEEVAQYEQELSPAEPTIFSKNSEDIKNIVDAASSIHETVHAIPTQEKTVEQPLDVELSDMFVPNTPSSAYQGLDTKTEAPKQFVKTNNNESNEGGFSDTATMVMLTTAGFFSIITIILAIAVLL